MLGSEAASAHGTVVKHFPALAGLPYRVLSESWHSTAIDVDDRIIFKFPRGEEARSALQREARLLASLRGRIAMTIPEMTLHEGPPLFSSHRKIPGRHLLATDYHALPDAAKQRLGNDLGRFYAELHRVDARQMEAAGAAFIAAWQPEERITSRAIPLLPDALRVEASAVVAAYADLAPDPYGETFGFFDGHGWNMAFDFERLRLNGVYDFADSGIGPVHQDFIYSSFVSSDLTARIIAAYEAKTGRAIDRNRLDILTGYHRLSELAELADDPDHAPDMVRHVAAWQADRLARH